MLRSEVQKKAGLTRKAIEYYEEKGLIKPEKYENGFRNYSQEDLIILKKISSLRRLGLSVGEIDKYLNKGPESLTEILRRQELKVTLDKKRKDILKLMISGEKEEIIEEELKKLEREESLYDKLERVFPGYFGQVFFTSYRPFLNESLNKEDKKAFDEFVSFLDDLPSFDLTEEEKAYIEEMTSSFDIKTLQDLADAKNEAVNNPEDWLEENKDLIESYNSYKNSPEYQNSPSKKIQDKLKKFMTENNFYEISIPLIRKFSRSYDAYYKKLLVANDLYLKKQKNNT